MPTLLRPAEPRGDGSRTTLAGGPLEAGFSDRVAFLLVLPALGATSGACAPTAATGSGAVEVLFCMVSDFARAVFASVPGVGGEGPLVGSVSGSPPWDSNFPGWKSGEGVTRSIFAWIVILYLCLPKMRVMFCATVWIGAGRGLGKRSSFATLGIVRQRVLICKCPQCR